MFEYLSNIWNTICNVIFKPEIIESYCNIISTILMGVIAIIGLGYLKPLKEKTMSATFNFWSQLKVRLLTIKKWLEQDCGLLDNLYSLDSKQEITVLTPENTRISEFKDIVKNTLDFIENSNDQMPAYIGWSKDYTELIAYLEDMVVYDICNHKQFFKFTSPITEEKRKKFRDDICVTITNICDGIDIKQNKVEKQLCKKQTLCPRNNRK